MKFTELIHQLVTDETFRSQTLSNPTAALAACEDLSSEEREALNDIPWALLVPIQDWRVPENPGWFGCQFNRFLTPPKMSTAI